MAGTVYVCFLANHSQLHRLEFAKSTDMDMLNSVSFLLEGLLYTSVVLISSALMVCPVKDSRITILLVSPLNGFGNWGC